MKKRYFVLVVLFISIAANTNAQKEWSLSECIEYAHANNLRVKSAEYQADIANNDLFQAKMNILPDVNAGASRYYNFGHTVDMQTNSFSDNDFLSDSYEIGASVFLFTGLRNYNNIKANEYLALSRLQDVEREKVEITFEIATAYLRILFNRELLEIARSQRDVTNLQVERTDKLVEAGSAARGDLLEIIAQRAAEDLNVTNAQNDLNLAYLNLTQLLDLDSVAGFEVFVPDTVDPDFAAPIIDVPTVFYDGLGFLPHVKSAEYTLLASEKNLAIQKGRLSPTLSLSSNWGTGYSENVRDLDGEIISYSEQFRNLDYQNLFITLRVPIFNKWSVKNDISNAKITVLDAENTLDLTKQQLYKEIQQAYNDAVSAKEKYKSANEAVISYAEAFGYTEQKFNVGIVNSVEYNIAKNNFIKAESDLLQAKYEYVFALKILDFYRGIPMTL
ncbi:MAG TPA: hypothetical protein DDX98_15800 [Bacteroidales bacterium]|jgi:outer membrane protein|nr:hypothetical protein [Bacteroidales bacterium]